MGKLRGEIQDRADIPDDRATRAHQDDSRFLEYWLQVHEDTGDPRELLQEPHDHGNQDGLVDEGVLDLSTGNPPALEGDKVRKTRY